LLAAAAVARVALVALVGTDLAL